LARMRITERRFPDLVHRAGWADIGCDTKACKIVAVNSVAVALAACSDEC